ncbi:MAG TPA: hypothetical protein VF886_02255, partial [Roseiarcus sp.]
MTVVERRSPAPHGLVPKRRDAALAGLALAASIALLLERVAPGGPAIVPMGLASLSAVSAVGLALTLEDEALPKLSQVL